MRRFPDAASGPLERLSSHIINTTRAPLLNLFAWRHGVFPLLLMFFTLWHLVSFSHKSRSKITLFQWVMEIEKPLTIEMLGQDQCQGSTHPPCQRMKSTPHLYFSTSFSQYPCGWVWNQYSLWNLAFRPEATPSRGSTQARRGKGLVPGNKS